MKPNELCSSNTQSLLQTALEHHRSGRLEKAEKIYKQILSRDPTHADALNLFGVIAHQLGQDEKAAAWCAKAIQSNPNQASFYNNLGTALVNLDGRLEDAVASFQQALKLQPRYVEALNNLGNALHQQRRLHEAVAQFQVALEINPQYSNAICNLANVQKDLGELKEAVSNYQRALTINPSSATALNNLGSVLQEQGKLEDAVTCFHRALKINPSYADALSNLGMALQEQGKVDDAITKFQCAIEIDPQSAEVHWNYSSAVLILERYEQGWPEYEWRWKRNDFKSAWRDFHQPVWDGLPLEDKTILLHTEQGLGDSIQFIRYAKLVAARGGRVIVECQPTIERLLQEVEGIDQVIAKGNPLPDFDCFLPIMSLPHVLGVTSELIPYQTHYISAKTELAEKWQNRLTNFQSPKIGICWQGNPTFKRDHLRSIPLKYFSKLFESNAATFISIHKGTGEKQIQEFGLEDKIMNFSSEMDDMAETAALIGNLDLVITSDTSIAHLAGAIGKPTWVLLPFAPDWRWLLDREDSPWYPSMRLFRQKIPNDWPEVFDRVNSFVEILVTEQKVWSSFSKLAAGGPQ